MSINPLKLANIPTPFHNLERLSIDWKGQIMIKRDDLTESGKSGNKIRKLEYLLADAVSRGADRIVTCGGVNSNHCRATALTCAQLGLKCTLLLRGDPAMEIDGNALLDLLAGAEIDYVSDEIYYSDLDGLLREKSAEHRANGDVPYIVTEGGSDPIGAWGYVEALRELKGQCSKTGTTPLRIVCATGSGGTHAGLFAGALLENWDVEIVSASVCYDENETISRISQIVDGMIDMHKLDIRYSQSDIRVLDGYIGPGYAKAGESEFRIIHEVASKEGLLVDPVYTGKAIRAIKEETLAGKMSGVTVFWHTGGMFGLFPFKEGLSAQ